MHKLPCSDNSLRQPVPLKRRRAKGLLSTQVPSVLLQLLLMGRRRNIQDNEKRWLALGVMDTNLRYTATPNGAFWVTDPATDDTVMLDSKAFKY
jgi:hypothetical protein